MILDANVFLEVLLDQRYRDECRDVLDRVGGGTLEASVTGYHVDAVAYIVEDATGDTAQVSAFLDSLLGYDGLSVLNQPLTEKIRACRIMEEEGLDFDDALAVRAAWSTASDRIVTLDTDFGPVEDVERLHPGEVR